MWIVGAFVLIFSTFCLGQGCWDKINNRRYTESLGLKIKTIGKCRAHCFDHNQIGNNCSAFSARDSLCYRQYLSTTFSRTKISFDTRVDTYFLHEDCEERNCWELASTSIGINEIQSENEKYCKRTCIETPDCTGVKWNYPICKLFLGAKEVWTLKESCMNTSCWIRQENMKLTDGQIINRTPVTTCRLTCLETSNCLAFSYDFLFTSCKIYTGGSGTLYQTVPSKNNALFTLKAECF